MSHAHSVYVSTLDAVWSHMTGQLRAVDELLLAEVGDCSTALGLSLPPQLREPKPTFGAAAQFAGSLKKLLFPLRVRTGARIQATPAESREERCDRPQPCFNGIIEPNAGGRPAPADPDRRPRAGAGHTAEQVWSFDELVEAWIATERRSEPGDRSHMARSTVIVRGGAGHGKSRSCYWLTLHLLTAYLRAGGIGLLPVRVNAGNLALKLTERRDAPNPMLCDAVVLLMTERWRKVPSFSEGADAREVRIKDLLGAAFDDGKVLLIVDDWEEAEETDWFRELLCDWQARGRPLLLASRTAGNSDRRFGDAECWQLVPPDGPARQARLKWIAGAALLMLVAVSLCLGLRRPDGANPTAPRDQKDAVPTRYRGKIDVLVERNVGGKVTLHRLNEVGVLPLRQNDKFCIEGEVDPPAYLYVVWVDPEHDVTPVHPWDPEEKGWKILRHRDTPMGKVSLPPQAGTYYEAAKAKPGVATIVLFARATPLDVPDEEVRKWFMDLPDLTLPPGGDGAAVWFDDYREVLRDPYRLRTFGVVGADDPFAQWQGRLQKVLGSKASFQTAISFARTGNK